MIRKITKFSLFLPVVLALATFQSIAQKAAILEDIYPRFDSLYRAEAYKACIKLETEIVASLSARKDTLAASMYFLLGDSYFLSGNRDRALMYYEKEIELRRILGQSRTSDFSNGLYNLTFLYGERGEYAKAKKTGEELLLCDAQLKGLESEEYASSLLFFIDILQKSGDFLKAKEVGEKGLHDVNNKQVHYASLLSRIADVYSSLGLYSKAETAFQNAIALLTQLEGENSLNVINTVINLSSLYRNQGRYPEAEEVLSSVISVLKLSNEEAYVKSYVTALNNLALIQQALSQNNEAEISLNEVLDSDKKNYGVKHPYYASTLFNLAFVLFDEARFKESEDLCKQALEILKDDKESLYLYAIGLNKLANNYRLNGDGSKAVPLYEEARTLLAQKVGESSAEYASATFNLGQAYYLMNDVRAKYELENALKSRTTLFGKKHPKYGEVTRKLAGYWWQQNNFSEATRFYDETFRNYFDQIDSYFSALSEDEKSTFYLGKLKPTFDEYYTFCVSHHKENPELLSKLYDYQLRTKAMIMYASQKVRNTILQSGDEVLIKSFNSWLEQKEQLAKLYSQGVGSPETTKKKIDSLTKETTKHEKYLTQKSALFTGTYKPKTISWKDVKRALKPGEAAVEIIHFREFSPASGGTLTGKVQYAFLIVTPETKDHPELVLLDNARPLETLFLSFYRNSILFNTGDTISYKNFWAHLNPKLKGYKKIYVSPDGVYNQINLATLKNPKTNQYLINEHEIKIVSNTKDLVAVKEKSKRKGKTILLGFPKYNSVEGQSGKKERRSLSRGGEMSISRGLRGNLLRYMRGDNGIPELPGTKEEVEKIKDLFNVDAQVQMIIDTLATEKFIKSQKNTEVLHIATHGFFLEDAETEKEQDGHKYVENPMLRSGLILAGAGDFLLQTNNQSPDDDGILSAYEVMNLNLDGTELVVLSACETGLGSVRNGEGVYGLQRAFQIAGAKSIIMSLWNVDDAATKELMINFYQELLKTQDKDMAFRVAQQRLMDHFKSPFYWGAFVMVGD
jgi:CHAT domain-containing protein/tetratricopeptide (TPR) repeat protein